MDAESVVLGRLVATADRCLLTVQSLGGEVVLPDGPGRYRVLISTDPEVRAELMRTVQDLVGTEPPGRDLDRFRALDGREWYELLIQYVEPVPDDPDDDWC